MQTISYHPQILINWTGAWNSKKRQSLRGKKSWLSALLIVLLGIRVTHNEWVRITPHLLLLIYWCKRKQRTSCLILVDADKDDNMGITNSQMKNLVKEMQKFETNKISNESLHSLSNSHVPKDLNTCKYVWLRTEFGNYWKHRTQVQLRRKSEIRLYHKYFWLDEQYRLNCINFGN